jgi:hypothetical protein
MNLVLRMESQNITYGNHDPGYLNTFFLYNIVAKVII